MTLENNTLAGERVREILSECDALLEGHFRYTSGRHGAVYFEKIRIVQRPDLVMELGRLMADLFSDSSDDIDIVCSPALGAIVFGFSTALAMGKPFAFLNRDPSGAMTMRSGFSVPPGSRVLLVEDVVTTGGSVRETVTALRAVGADVVRIGLLVDRTGGSAEFEGVPFRSLMTVDVESWDAADCPLCADGVEITVPGSTGKA